MAVGDTVVWWRATALYPQNRIVKGVGALLVLATLGETDRRPLCMRITCSFMKLAAGVVNIQQSVSGPSRITSFQMENNFEVYNLGLSGGWDVPLTGGQIFENSASGLAAAALSFSTNVIATGLVIYKAWCVPA